MSYKDSTYLYNAAMVLKTLKSTKLTTEQLQDRLPELNVPYMVQKGHQQGWLKRFVNWNYPNVVYWQVENNMIRFNWSNRLIAAAVKNLVNVTSGETVPAAYVSGFGIASEVYLLNTGGVLSSGNVDAPLVVVDPELLPRPPNPTITVHDFPTTLLPNHIIE